MNQINEEKFATSSQTQQDAALNKACEGFQSRNLFYPCSGQDFTEPIEKFLPFIDEFWFVDLIYKLDKPLLPKGLLEHLKTNYAKETGLTLRKKTPFKVQIRTDTYLEQSSNRKIKVHSCKGRGYDTFRIAFRNTGKQLSIFFHRGDSPGEGGSNFHWLGTKMLKYVLLHLEPNGLIVTDGSLACGHFTKATTPFQTMRRSFKPIAEIDPRYGPTVVWKASN